MRVACWLLYRKNMENQEQKKKYVENFRRDFETRFEIFLSKINFSRFEMQNFIKVNNFCIVLCKYTKPAG